MSRPAGYTLIELLIAAVVTATLAVISMGALAGAVRIYINAQQEQLVASDVDRTVAALVDEIERGGQTVEVLTPSASEDPDQNTILHVGRRVYCLARDADEVRLSRFTWNTDPGAVVNTPVTCTTSGLATAYAVAPATSEVLENGQSRIRSFDAWELEANGDTAAIRILVTAVRERGENRRANEASSTQLTVQATAVRNRTNTF